MVISEFGSFIITSAKFQNVTEVVYAISCIKIQFIWNILTELFNHFPKHNICCKMKSLTASMATECFSNWRKLMKPFREKDSTVNSMKTHIKSLCGISREIHYCQESSTRSTYQVHQSGKFYFRAKSFSELGDWYHLSPSYYCSIFHV